MIVLALLLAGVSLLYGAQIRVDTDLRALLPKTAPSVVALDTIEARKGSAERLVVAVESPDEQANAIMIDELAAEVSSWSETSGVSIHRDFTPLRDHALYFLELAQIDELRETLTDQRKQAVAGALGPGLTGDPIDIEAIQGDDWDAPTDQAALDEGAPPSTPPAAAEPGFDLDRFLTEQREAAGAHGQLSNKELQLIWPGENEAGEIVWEPRIGEPYASETGDIRVLQASLSIPATDVEFAQEVVARIEARVAAAKARGVAVDARVEVVAAYDVSKEVDTIVRDAARATWISATLIIAVLGLGFWSARALVLVLVPVAVSMAVTLAVATAVYGELNALTVFLFAVLLGMGVDFGVHLYAQRQAQGRDADWPAVVSANLRPLTATMLTTVGCLVALRLAEFQAFREFGVISALGVTICFVFALVLVPVIDSLLGPLRRVTRVGRAGTPGLRVPAKLLRPLQVARVALLVGLAVFGMLGAPKLGFERDTRALRSQTAATTHTINYGATGGRCAKTLALLADDPAELDLVVARMQAEQTKLLPGAVETGAPRTPWVREVYSLRTLMPTDQLAKQRSIAPLIELTNGFLAELPELDAQAQQHRSHLEALERLSKAKPLEVSELPDWAVEPFTEKDGRSDRIAHACLDIAGWSIDELIAVRDRLDVLTEGTDVLAADSRLVFADLMALVEHDARRLPIWALLIMLVFIALDLRRLIPTLICAASLGLGLILTLGIMGEWPLRLNFFNIVVMPAVVGLGIDASIHLWHARTGTNLGATSRAAMLATLTTVAGFSGLLAADHLGLRSIGEVGILALSVCVGVAFLVLYPLRAETR
ncbi:MMPL family protein [Enhygromyxa salina]|uniref:MMPL family protein n=2 Tax=Enhygromyxa salina TaxID=215803 RepID=A0A2S9Y2K8_9BACT|nr:MMPL family protein [Enhygromyxa salina]